MLRNPNLQVFGMPVSQNIYVIGSYTAHPINGTVNVEVMLCSYTDESKAYKIREKGYMLTDLVNIPADLNPEVFQEELLLQHGEKEQDGTKLNDYEVLS